MGPRLVDAAAAAGVGARAACAAAALHPRLMVVLLPSLGCLFAPLSVRLSAVMAVWVRSQKACEV